MVESTESGGRIDCAGDFPAPSRHRLAGQEETLSPDMIVDHQDVSSPAPTGAHQVLLERCKMVYAIRRKRDRTFGPLDIFCDPAWDILLHLFIDHLNGKRSSKTSAAHAACVPQTTALRWLSILENNGIVRLENDIKDRRRVYVILSETGIRDMTRVLSGFESNASHR